VYQSDFTADEFKARRRRLCSVIGKNAVALLQGAPGPKGHDAFRQYNDFYYLCGVETPRAYLLLQGANERATVFLPHKSQLEKQSEDKLLCAESADFVCKTTGVDEALAIEQLGERLQRASVAYIPFEDGQGRTVNRHHAQSWAPKVYADPWDGRLTRAAYFLDTVRRRFPQIEIKDLSPHMDELRLVKSPQEIALLRRAGHLTAIGVKEAMRSTRPGVMEYQLDAVMRYHFLAGGAGDRAYHAIIAGGVNAFYGHYGANDSELKDGDWVLVDGAPDYHYYTSDIGRMWPVNGRYTPVQRALYGFVVEYHKALLGGLRPGRTVGEIHQEAASKMKGVVGRFRFASPRQEEGVRAMFEFRGHISHSVGMSVHDGFGHHSRPLESGMVFSVDPQLWVPAEKLYVRVEDTVVVTDGGIENLTSEAPLELGDVEMLLRQEGLLQRFPPA
jgi:Xaa-Pro aminopeptidase